jgi:hypothetical protein
MNILHKLFNPFAEAGNGISATWIADLLSMDDICAIEILTKKLAHDFKHNVFHNAQNIEALIYIDEKTHSIVERITQYFVLIENINHDLKTRISNAAFLYHRQLFLTYVELSKNYPHSHQHTLHIVLSRALKNATQMIKWQQHNHHHEPANFWSEISGIFKAAEQSALLNAKIQSYSGLEPVSLSSAYLQACMLGSVQSVEFRPQQIEIVSRLLSTWASKISIDTAYDAKHHLFYIDTAANVPARRIKDFTAADSYRYWCFEDVNARIELCMLLIEYKISPKQQQMKELISEKYAAETLATLAAEWSRTTLQAAA